MKHLIDGLRPFMLSCEYKPPHTQYVINQVDSLFWAFFVLYKGYNLYETPGFVCFLKEKEEKYICIDVIKKNNFLLKQMRINNFHNEIEDDLANNSVICINTFIALCVAHHVDIFFIEKLKYYESRPNASNIVHYENATATILQNIDKNPYYAKYFRCENISRPLKSESSFKRDELLAICEKMGLIDKIGIFKKHDLYQLIKNSV